MGDYDFVCDFSEVGILEKGVQGGEPEKMTMYGWASSPARDAEQERVLQDGLDISNLTKSGWINWNHQSEKIIGIPRVAEVREREGFGKGIYTEFDLLADSPLAREVWSLAKALKPTTRRLGLSVEGKKIAVDKRTGTIKKARVLNIAVCPNPVNAETTVDALVKAIVREEPDMVERFSLLPASDASELSDRVVAIVGQAMAKALDAGHDVGGTTQTGGAALRPEGLDLVSVSPEDIARIQTLPDAEMQQIGSALVSVAGTRDGRLTKAEAALFTFLLSEETPSSPSLLDCMRVFGLE